MFLSNISSCFGIALSNRGKKRIWSSKRKHEDHGQLQLSLILPLTADRFRPHKWPGFERTGSVFLKVGQDSVECVFREPLVIVFVDLHHRRSTTGSEAFDRSEAKKSIRGRLTR